MNIARPIKPAEIDNSQDIDVEGNIRELVRRDSAALRETADESEIAASDLGALLGRVSGSSMREIDNLIDELKGLRDKLQSDGNRVQRDVADYAALTQSVMQLTKIITDGVTQVKRPDGANGHDSERKSLIGAAARDI